MGDGRSNHSSSDQVGDTEDLDEVQSPLKHPSAPHLEKRRLGIGAGKQLFTQEEEATNTGHQKRKSKGQAQCL
jgi:hypothetical protein